MSLLTISIPIYNRAKYLERMLNRFMLDKFLFEDTIHLFISDNCSEDDLQSICLKYRNEGLQLEYSRNEKNLGMDGNFEICINKGLESDYLWVLGSDDIPSEGLFDLILPILRTGVNSLHLSMTEGEIQEIEYNNVEEYLKDVNVMITFLSANLISSREISHVNMQKYKNSYFTQMPVYLTTIFSGSRNVMLRCKYLQKGNDSLRNGGYNFYRVFVENYLNIWTEFLRGGQISKETYEFLKEHIYKTFIKEYTLSLLFFHENIKEEADDKNGFEIDSAWQILFKHYGTKSYFWKSFPWFFYKYIRHKTKQIFRC